jgi:arylsulfatase
MFKQWVHEGGIATPLIAHWPEGIEGQGRITHKPGHIIDIMTTCCDVAGAEYPESFKGQNITPMPGISLVPDFKGKEREDHDALFWEHMGNQAVRMGDWKLVSKKNDSWELYNLAKDRTELKDLSDQEPEKKQEMLRAYGKWSMDVGVRDR